MNKFAPHLLAYSSSSLLTAKAPKALHLTASLQVVRAHQRRRHVSIEDARKAIKEGALRIAQGTAGPETRWLAAKLEKVTGCSIAELVAFAEDWPA